MAEQDQEEIYTGGNFIDFNEGVKYCVLAQLLRLKSPEPLRPRKLALTQSPKNSGSKLNRRVSRIFSRRFGSLHTHFVL